MDFFIIYLYKWLRVLIDGRRIPSSQPQRKFKNQRTGTICHLFVRTFFSFLITCVILFIILESRILDRTQKNSGQLAANIVKIEIYLFTYLLLSLPWEPNAALGFFRFD